LRRGDHAPPDAYIEAVTERAYRDVVASGRYSYASFVRSVDEVLEEELGSGSGAKLVAAFIGYEHGATLEPMGSLEQGVVATLPTMVCAEALTPSPRPPLVLHLPQATSQRRISVEQVAARLQRVRVIGRAAIPAPLRRLLKPCLRPIWRMAKRTLRPGR